MKFNRLNSDLIESDGKIFLELDLRSNSISIDGIKKMSKKLDADLKKYNKFFISELDGTHNYGLYSTSATEQTSGTTNRVLALDTNDRQDTGFSLASNIVTITNAGRYVMTYNLDISQTATSREDAVGFLRRNGTTPVVGSYSYCYQRGIDGTQDGALTWIGVVDVVASDTFEVVWGVPTSVTMTASAGAKLQIWQLPNIADCVIAEATTGTYNTNTDFVFGTLPFIDTASFTATAGTSNIDVDQKDYVLSFATLSQAAPDTPQRPYPEAKFRKNNTIVTHSTAGVYHRNSGGSGIIAINIASIFPTKANDSIEMYTAITGASGTLNNDSAQFSIVSLTSIFGAYTYDPSITAQGDGQLDPGDLNELIDGDDFEATQGTGKVELGDSPSYSGATKVLQTIDTWGNLQIQFDPVFTGLSQGSLYVFVTNNTGDTSIGFKVNYGIGSYFVDVNSLAPDIYHTFDNTYADDMGTGFSANGQTQTGTIGFQLTPITRSSSYSFRVDTSTSGCEMVDTGFTNITNTHAGRYIGGWVQFDRIHLVPSGIWKEGAQINNIYMVIGFGNRLLGNMADSNSTPNIKIQAYSDFKLSINRPYHIMVFYQGTGGTDEFGMYVDGVKVLETNGNPMAVATMNTHSGDWGYGDPDGTLDTGGSDISYGSAPMTLFSNWATWSEFGGGAPLTDTEIRVELFEKGARETDTIISDTLVNMQTALDLLSGTYVDKVLAIKFEKPTDASIYEIILNDIIFDDRCSIHVMVLGPVTATIINKGTSNAVLSKCSSPYSGTVIIKQSVKTTITVKDIVTGLVIQNSRVYVTADVGGDLTSGTLLLNGITDVNGEASFDLTYTNDQPITGWVRDGSGSTKYQQSKISNTITSSGLDQTIFLIEN